MAKVAKSISGKSGVKHGAARKPLEKTAADKNLAKAPFQPPPPVVENEPSGVVGKRSKHLSADKKRELHEKLMRLRERFTGQINFLATDNLSRTPKDIEVDFRSEEQGTDNFDRDSALNRVSLEQDIIFEIDEALNRIKLGTFGLCIACNGPIEKARLDALPYSRMCIECQSHSEAGRKKVRTFETAALFPNADKALPEVAAEED
ncbi:MAG: TraR/DksA C4-type zinc finger protein [Lentisphaerae bacterium]|nr:TraR/DksA C4-type zinc finger protein [Lentisphaerota bacterium]